MKYIKGQKLICIKESVVRFGNAPTIKEGEIVIVQGVGSGGALWFKHSHSLGGNFDPEDFSPILSYEIY